MGFRPQELGVAEKNDRRLLAPIAGRVSVELEHEQMGHASRSSGAPEAGTGAQICRPLM